MGMSDRISAIIREKKLTKSAFAKKINVSQPFVTQLTSGDSAPSDRTISDICREFDVSEKWLRTGTGEMFRPLTRSEVIADFAADLIKDEPDSFRRRLVEALAKLGPEEWEILERIAKDLAKKGLRISLSPIGACKISKSG